jgi:3-oxoacyl-[acyl-carrier protein] reductase
MRELLAVYHIALSPRIRLSPRRDLQLGIVETIKREWKKMMQKAGTAIVTGASGGIGKGIAERLAADGFSVVVHYGGNAAKAEEVVKGIEHAGGKAIAVGADISKVIEVQQLFEKAKAAFGNLNVVVNSAGIMTLAPIVKGDVDAFDKIIATNLRGSYLIMSEAANHVVDGGRIIVFSSSVLGKNFPSYGAYIASKAGVEGLTRVLANELGQRKITVNAVAPGPVATELFLKGKSEELIAEIAKMGPLGRIGEVDDIVGVVAFLVGREGGWVNGQIIRVNGGYA